MDIPSTILQQTALTQENIALSVIKSSAQADQAVANILEQSLTVQPSPRGANVNLSA